MNIIPSFYGTSTTVELCEQKNTNASRAYSPASEESCYTQLVSISSPRSMIYSIVLIS